MQEIEITEEERASLLGTIDETSYAQTRDGRSFKLNGERGFVLRDNGTHVIADVYDKNGRISDLRTITNSELENAEWLSGDLHVLDSEDALEQ